MSGAGVIALEGEFGPTDAVDLDWLRGKADSFARSYSL
jgi:hypothetical protein